METHRRNREREHDANRHDRNGHQGGEHQAVEEPAMAVMDVTSFKRPRHQRVQPEQDAHAEHGEGDVHRDTHAHSADRFGSKAPNP